MGKEVMITSTGLKVHGLIIRNTRLEALKKEIYRNKKENKKISFIG